MPSQEKLAFRRLWTYDYSGMTTENKKLTTRARTLRWKNSIDEIAIQLAAERGVPVNKLLELLVREELETPRLIANPPSPGYAALILAKGMRKQQRKGKR